MRTQARECARGSVEESVIPGATEGAHRRVARVVWVSVNGDGTGRDEDESQDGILEGVRFSPEVDLPPVGPLVLSALDEL